MNYVIFNQSKVATIGTNVWMTPVKLVVKNTKSVPKQFWYNIARFQLDKEYKISVLEDKQQFL